MTNNTAASIKRKITEVNKQISNTGDFDVACSLLSILQSLEWELKALKEEQK